MQGKDDTFDGIQNICGSLDNVVVYETGGSKHVIGLKFVLIYICNICIISSELKV